VCIVCIACIVYIVYIVWDRVLPVGITVGDAVISIGVAVGRALGAGVGEGDSPYSPVQYSRCIRGA
jgi:hypothetical protein